MSAAIRAQITKELGVEPICINSALVSAQNRQRLYWVGRRNSDGAYSQVAVEQPANRGILLRDILESGVCWREKSYTLKANYTNAGAVNGVCGQHFPAPMAAEPVRIGTIENEAKNQDFDSQQYRVYSPDGKSVTLCGNGGGLGAKTGLYAVPVEEPVNTTADGKAQCLRATYYKDGIRNMVGNTVDRKTCVAIPVCIEEKPVAEPICINGLQTGKSRTVDAHMAKLEGCLIPRINDPNPAKQQYDCIVEPIRVGAMPNQNGELGTSQSRRIYSIDGKQLPVYEVRGGFITIKEKQYPIKLADGFYIIRKLTVTECKRLQTVPDTYVFPVSPTQAYKMLGNGWTVDVIAHIMSHFDGLTAEPVEVLSMYDGMSCGHIALDKLGVMITTYYATEIDKYAIQTTQHNFPNTVQLGDAFQVRDNDWELRKER